MTHAASQASSSTRLVFPVFRGRGRKGVTASAAIDVRRPERPSDRAESPGTLGHPGSTLINSARLALRVRSGEHREAIPAAESEHIHRDTTLETAV